PLAAGEAPPVHAPEQTREAVAVEVAAERGAVLAEVSEPERRGTLLEGAVRALQVDELVAGVDERALDARRRHRDVDVGPPVPVEVAQVHAERPAVRTHAPRRPDARDRRPEAPPPPLSPLRHRLPPPHPPRGEDPRISRAPV